MADSRAEISTDRVDAGAEAGWRLLRRVPGRNRTKADVLVYDSARGPLAVKDYGPRPWWVRQTLGRCLIRRESAAYAVARGAAGLAPFFGRRGAFSLVTGFVEARKLSDHADGEIAVERFERLEALVRDLHERGVALADLNHRDVLLADGGAVYVIDLAMAWTLGRRPSAFRRRLFDHFRKADLFALARLRARFTGESVESKLDAADPAAVAWHRRARRLKYRWDRLRGAERRPPVNDHWRF